MAFIHTGTAQSCHAQIVQTTATFRQKRPESREMDSQENFPEHSLIARKIKRAPCALVYQPCNPFFQEPKMSVSQHQVTLPDAPRFMMDFLSAWGVHLFYLAVFSGYLIHAQDYVSLAVLAGCASAYFALLWFRQKRRRAFRDFVERVRQAAEENGETLPHGFMGANRYPASDNAQEVERNANIE
jgi:hypothetical protein